MSVIRLKIDHCLTVRRKNVAVISKISINSNSKNTLISCLSCRLILHVVMQYK